MTNRRPSIIRDEHNRQVRNIRQSMLNGWLVVCVGAVLIALVLVVRELMRRREQGVY